MNKAELIAAVAAKTGDTKKAAEASVNAFVEVVTDALKEGDKVQLVGFGSFEVEKRDFLGLFYYILGNFSFPSI